MIIRLISTGFFLLLVCVVIPILAGISKKKMDELIAIARLPFYAEAAAVQLILLPIGLWSAVANDIDFVMFGRVSIGDLLWGALLLSSAMIVMVLSWPVTSLERRRTLRKIVPTNGPERAAWIGVSAVAALVEETLYRGVLFGLFFWLTGSWLISALSSSLFFGLAHLVQGWKSSLIVGVFGLAFHLLVLVTGTLAVAIAVHFLYDLIAGYAIGLTRDEKLEMTDHAQSV